MASILKKARDRVSNSSSTSKMKPFFPEVVRTSYTNLPIPIPSDFLAPLPDASVIEVNQIDFKKSVLPEYRGLYAVVLDNVLSQSECDQFIHLAEKSVGAHQEGEEQLENNGWKPAMVNAGRNHEVLALDYRNSDRIIWDEKEVVKRLWDRVLQAKEVKDYITVLDGKKYTPVIGPRAEIPDERYKSTEQGINERMRFLKYGAGQFFKQHCDGAYETEDGLQRSYYTIHLYLNDSAQALSPSPSEKEQPDILRGGATTFHSTDMKQRIDVDPKAGRVLIFQHRRLLHSGDEVKSGVKYTMRSDLMYEYESSDVKGGDIVFG